MGATPGEDLCFLPAVEQRARIARGELSARELLEAHLARIEALNPPLNAIVTLVPERARGWAAAADERQARGEPLGCLHGLPVAHKDLVMTAGIRSTMGSRLLAEHVPATDDLVVERLRAAGAITSGKTNVPEFGAGSQTYNEVFGETLNPWDRSRTCGGSSGGAAVALAAGLVPIADGSDMGGSLRNPASFCNVVGFRPSLGRVPSHPSPMAYLAALDVLGPMGRTVQDAALLLSAMAGPDPRVPVCLERPGADFAVPLGRELGGVRVAWGTDLGGLPVDPRVTRALEPGRALLAGLGCVVEDAELDWTGAEEAFQTLRAFAAAQRMAGLPAEAFAQLKDTLRWNVERGRALTPDDLGRAEKLRSQLFARLAAFQQRFEFLALPVSLVPPFDVKLRYPTEVAGVAMQTYIDWMMSCCFVRVTGCPAISVPCGFTDDGLPVGLQLVGRPRDDLGVLQLAFAFQEATELWRRRPTDVP